MIRMKTPFKILVLVVPIILIAVVILRIASSDAPANSRHLPPTLVKVETPTRETMVESVELNGDILPIQQAGVYARVTGNLENVFVNIGDHVAANQLLARIDTVELGQQYRQASATYDNATAVYDRSKSLLEHSLIAKQDFDAAETAMKVAKENAETARTRLDYAEITAPFTGYITRRYLDPGALVSSTSTTLFTLADLDAIKIIVNALEKDIPKIHVGTKAVVTVDAYPGRDFVGAIARLSQQLDLTTRTMPVEIDIPNKEHILKPGMFADVSLVLSEQPNVLTVPTSALLREQGGYYVYLLQNGVAHRAEVQIGAEQQSRTEIQSGLQDSDKVITTGQQFARDGGPVTVQP
jgi:RND family efflux transporter MFP subunit